MPWRTQVGMSASELSRASRLQQEGGGPEVLGCLQRARELIGVLDSTPGLPIAVAAGVAPVAKELSLKRLPQAPARAGEFYGRLMELCRLP